MSGSTAANIAAISPIHGVTVPRQAKHRLGYPDRHSDDIALGAPGKPGEAGTVVGRAAPGPE
jgi:hypothetical protein